MTDSNTVSNKPEKFVIYRRVSTVAQFQSQLGLEAQSEAINRFLGSHPNANVVGEFTETESGKKSDRPALKEARDLCRRHRATLVIAKLDRLARNVHFVSGLLAAGVDVLALDFPSRDRFALHLAACFAEHELTVISQRTKDALAAGTSRTGDHPRCQDPRISRLLSL